MSHSISKVLVTGAAGFIGYHVSRQLLAGGREIVGVDNFNDYYSPSLKHERIELLETEPGFQFQKMDLVDSAELSRLFENHGFDGIVHLAAQAGVRYSLENPAQYVASNLDGTANILESCRHHRPRHVVFASSSSVYGLNTSRPYKVSDNVDHPVSLYAATKKANELMAHSYAHLFDLPITGLRFFTVYGPWGRPDMAYFKFARAILEGDTIQLYANGRLRRDYTYIDDIVDGVLKVLDTPAEAVESFNTADPDPSISLAPYRLYNIGRGKPFSTREMLDALQKAMDKEAVIEELGMQPGEVEETWADVSVLTRDTGYEPKVDFEDGLTRFVEWFMDRYGSGDEIPR
jgi:UDP-glucuronate 4-epimerase